MSKIGNILLSKPFFEKHRVDCIDDAVIKAYSAGAICKFGTLIVGGIGKNAATNWARYTEVKVSGIPFNFAIDCLQWFTEIHNKAGKNQGVTTEKTHFCLTQQTKEIQTLLTEFGLTKLIAECHEKAETHDTELGLKEEVHEYGGVAYWEDRTIGFIIPLMSKETEIFNAVEASILSEPIFLCNSYSHFNPQNAIFEAFVAGQKGLQIGSNDLQELKQKIA